MYNEIPVNEKQLSWADVICVMEDSQRSEIGKRFPKQYLQKRIINLDILDVYSYMDEELVKVLKVKVDF